MVILSQRLLNLRHIESPLVYFIFSTLHSLGYIVQGTLPIIDGPFLVHTTQVKSNEKSKTNLFYRRPVAVRDSINILMVK